MKNHKTTINSLKIWVADDDDIYRFILIEILKKYIPPENIEAFPEGESLLEEINSSLQDPDQLPDYILLDLNMPIMDGWEFLDQFIKLQVPNKIFINIVTSSYDQADINKAKDYPVVSNYYIKPISNEAVEEILKGAINI
ncbi:MAG: response regulator [Leptospiraceae bacterium]|nr:response regulator [Leptospiraceae bacterium]